MDAGYSKKEDVMAGRTMVEMKGLDNLINKTRKFKESVQEEVDLELTASAMAMDATAKKLAPADKGGGSGIRGRMFVDTTQFLSKKVGNTSEYAAYQEFGTGVHAAEYVATLPPDWQEYAKGFYVNGEGRTPAHPFLFPAFEEERPKLIKRIKKILGWKRFFK
jgi:HK97 gp10 family phage protein